jgi:hypothetical protein
MRVIDTFYDLCGLGNEDLWFVDPFHPIDPVYRSIDSAIIKLANSLKKKKMISRGGELTIRKVINPSLEGHMRPRTYGRASFQNIRIQP